LKVNMKNPTAVNLNADMGERFGCYTMGDDEALLKVVKSASIACGFHAGDPTVMAETVRCALQQDVSIGAHPGFRDLQGFGRRRIHMAAYQIEHMVAYQIGALQGIAAAAGARVTHVKPHGALNNMAHTDVGYATAIARAIRAVDRELIFVANVGSAMVRAGADQGLRVAEEAYIDRGYDDDGQLASRDQPGALIHDVQQAVNQVITFMEEQALVTRSGQRIPCRIHTWCAHGDGPAGTRLITAVRAALEARGISIVSLPELSL